MQITASNSILDSGQWVTWTLFENGGIGPTFPTELYNITGSAQQGSNRIITSVGGSNTISFQVSSPTESNVFVFGGNSYDTGTTTHFPFISSAVTNTITVGKAAQDVAFSPDGSLAYVTNIQDDTVSVVNTATNTLINTITVGSGPFGVAFSPSGSVAYITNEGDGTVSVVDVATNTAINTITVGSGPESMAFSASGSLAYVTNYGATVNVINVATNTIVNTISVGTAPLDIALSRTARLHMY